MSDLVKQLRTKATMISLGERRSEESERRVSACVNACEGFSTESLELPEFFSATMRGYRVMVEEGEARIAELEAQIDELKRRLEVDERHGYDGIASRDMTIKELESHLDSIQKKADTALAKIEASVGATAEKAK